MAVTTKTVLTYPLADFVIGNGVNAPVLLQELTDDATITNTAESVSQSGTNVVCTFDGLLTSAMVTAADAVVANHDGVDLESPDQDENDETEDTDSSDTYQTKVTLTSGPLPAGTYRISWSAELWVTTEGAGNKAQGRVRLMSAQFPSLTTISEGSKNQDAPDTWASGASIQVVNGENITLQLQYRSQNGATAHCSAARLFLNRTSD